MGDLSRNFSSKEFACKCCCGQVNLSPRLIDGLQRLRDLAGEPIRITSGYRCPAHNTAVGGVPDSQHTKGQAADISIGRKTTAEIKALAEQIDVFADGGIGGYPNHGFVHVDVRGHKARWGSFE